MNANTKNSAVRTLAIDEMLLATPVTPLSGFYFIVVCTLVTYFCLFYNQEK
jgi:hypothetical protein